MIKDNLRKSIASNRIRSKALRCIVDDLLACNAQFDWTDFVKHVDEKLLSDEVESEKNELALKELSGELLKNNDHLQFQKKELEKLYLRYKLALIATNDGIFEWDPRSGACYFSPRWLQMLHVNESEEKDFTIDDWYQQVHPSHLAQLKSTLEAYKNGLKDRVEIEYQIRTASGYFIWVELRTISHVNENDEVFRVVGAQTDVTVRHENEKALYEAAFHDELTGLPNRALFLNRLEQVIERERRLGEKPACVLFVDVDRFKFINDTFGHDFGDNVLMLVSEVLRHNIRPADTVARLGGDEFTVLLNEVDGIDEATHVASRMLNRLNRVYEIDGRETHISTSIGLTMVDSAQMNASLILRNADVAMYQAKTSGRGRLEIFDNKHHKIISDRVKLETELRKAVRANQFEAHYQPLIELCNGEVTSFEALIRWDHPERGFIPPTTFIPVAEDIGLISKIGERVLSSSFEMIENIHKAVKDRKGPLVAVNLSVRQLMDDRSFDRVLSMIKSHKKLISNLRLEVTEGIIIQEPGLARERLEILKALGVSIALDDFGTGYSSLGYLNSFPFDILKIDQRFTSVMTIDEKAFKLVKSIMSMARDLDLETVAEGIETQEQLDLMRDLGCTYAQGYLISKALEQREALMLIRQGKTYNLEAIELAS